MKITELSNLFVAYNEKENFRMLICALDNLEAMEIARGYAADTDMSTNPNDWNISEFTDVNTNFDCDYAVSNGQ